MKTPDEIKDAVRLIQRDPNNMALWLEEFREWVNEASIGQFAGLTLWALEELGFDIVASFRSAHKLQIMLRGESAKNGR